MAEWAMADDTHNVSTAYKLKTPNDSERFYRDWAAHYDREFADSMGYRSPSVVAAGFADAGGQGPVLDIGAGTGLVGSALRRAGVTPVDGIDISQEMLAEAERKGVYRTVFRADLTMPLKIPNDSYAGFVSAGTFTTGHVGPEAFDELLRIARPGALFSVSVHEAVYKTGGFAAAFAAMGDRITEFQADPFEIYGPDADAEHAADRGWLVRFRRRNL